MFGLPNAVKLLDQVLQAPARHQRHPEEHPRILLFFLETVSVPGGLVSKQNDTTADQLAEKKTDSTGQTCASAPPPSGFSLT